MTTTAPGDLPRRRRGTGSIYRDGAAFRATITVRSPAHPGGRALKRRFDTFDEADGWLTAIAQGAVPVAAVTPPAPGGTRLRRSLPRRRRGTGSIYQDGDSFRARITLSDAHGGDPVEFKKRCDTYDQAAEYLDGLLRETQGSGAVPSRRSLGLTVGEYSQVWLATKRHSVGSKTFVLYEGTLKNHIVPRLGTIPLKNLRRQDIQRFVNSLTTTAQRSARPMALSTRQGIWRVLRTMLTEAVAEHHLLVSPMSQSDAPRNDGNVRAVTKRERAMPDGDVAQLAAAFNSPRYVCTADNHAERRCGVDWLLRLSLGVRQGEVLACQVEDVTITYGTAKGVARVPLGGRLRLHQHAARRQYQHGCGTPNVLGGFPCGRKLGSNCPSRGAGGMYAEVGLKSQPNGERLLSLSPELAAQLDAHIRVLSEEGLGRPEHFLIGRGTVMRTPEIDTHLWHALLDDSGLERKWRIHDLRHTAISRVVNGGLPIYFAQQLAGHATSKTTEGYIQADSQVTSTPVAMLSTLIAALGRTGVSPESIAAFHFDAGEPPEDIDPALRPRSAINVPYEDASPF